ncbi:MAG: hypothetical protein WAQ28_00420 [Bacteroidia bacterium]
MEINNWAQYLQDTRNDLALLLLKPIEVVLKDNALSAEEKNMTINKIVENLYEKMKTWDIKKYGITLP